jgi:hypothetical protein
VNDIRKILLVMYMCVPFILGVLLFYSGIVNIFSSLCLFLGGYILLKNTLDYRVVKRNKEFVKRDNVRKKDYSVETKSCVKSRKRDIVRVRKK